MTTQERIEYYQDKHVRRRIMEFLGGDSSHAPTSRYIVAGDQFATHLEDPRSTADLGSAFDQGFEIFRSLWDESSLLADFDVEYVNFDHPAEAFVESQRVFELLQPLADEIDRTLNRCEIPRLHFLSGRGHHFVWRIRRDSAEFRRLAKLGRGPDSLWSGGYQSHLPDGKKVPEELARAFAGLGLLMEFLAYGIQQRAAPNSAIPIELTAVEVGPSQRGREMLSIDISEYGDPLSARLIRAAFGIYLKPWQQRWAIEAETLEHLPPLFVVPVNGSWIDGIRAMRDGAVMTELAKTRSATIPDSTASMQPLMDAYESSEVANFHRWFYSEQPHPPEQWPDTYDRLALDLLPICVRMLLEKPNDLLLRPANIRRLVRVMLALGWHPRHIAGLIHSKYARPFGWTQFHGYDAATRAEFYTRIFAGAFVTGYDDLVDFNCTSTQEQKLCAFVPCSFNLMDFKKSALNRRIHDQLAHRPFNRLLL